jgi:hypothetical protein
VFGCNINTFVASYELYENDTDERRKKNFRQNAT